MHNVETLTVQKPNKNGNPEKLKAHHAGQTGLLRRITGKEGAIK